MGIKKFVLGIFGKHPKEEETVVVVATKEELGDVVNDVAANVQEGFWDRFVKDLNEQVKLLPKKRYWAYRADDVQIIPKNDKVQRRFIAPTNQAIRRKPRQQIKK